MDMCNIRDNTDILTFYNGLICFGQLIHRFDAIVLVLWGLKLLLFGPDLLILSSQGSSLVRKVSIFNLIIFGLSLIVVFVMTFGILAEVILMQILYEI
jgi:hypothetical protein